MEDRYIRKIKNDYTINTNVQESLNSLLAFFKEFDGCYYFAEVLKKMKKIEIKNLYRYCKINFKKQFGISFGQSLDTFDTIPQNVNDYTLLFIHDTTSFLNNNHNKEYTIFMYHCIYHYFQTIY